MIYASYIKTRKGHQAKFMSIYTYIRMVCVHMFIVTRTLNSAYGSARSVTYKTFLWDLHIYHQSTPRTVAMIALITFTNEVIIRLEQGTVIISSTVTLVPPRVLQMITYTLISKWLATNILIHLGMFSALPVLIQRWITMENLFCISVTIVAYKLWMIEVRMVVKWEDILSVTLKVMQAW